MKRCVCGQLIAEDKTECRECRASSCTVGADVVRRSRAETAGRATGTAIVEMVHLMYQNHTAANFWRGLMAVLNANGRKPHNAPDQARVLPSPEAGCSADDPRTYACDHCGRLRNKAEGGNIFTLCDECWDKHFKKPNNAVSGGAERRTLDGLVGQGGAK